MGGQGPRAGGLDYSCGRRFLTMLEREAPIYCGKPGPYRLRTLKGGRGSDLPPTMALQIECVNSFAHAPTAEEWDTLLARSTAHAIFASRPFQESWWDAFCRDSSCSCSCQLHLLVLREGGTLIGVAPFYLAVQTAAGLAEEQARARDWARIVARATAAGAEDAPEARTARMDVADGAPPAAAPRLGERVLRLAGGVAVTDYLDVIALAGREAEVWAAVLAHWAAQADAWDVLDIHSLPDAGGTAARVQAAAERPEWTVWSAVEETCPALGLPGDWESYLAQLNKKDRHELRRKLRRAESLPEPPTWKLHTAGPELAYALDELIALHRQGGEAKAEFMTPQMERFFQSLLPAFGATGRLEVATLYAGAHPVAATLSFRDGGRLLLYNSGFDPCTADWGAGFVLLVHRIRKAVAEGITVLDFLRGDERYKYDLGAQDHYLHRVIIRKRLYV